MKTHALSLLTFAVIACNSAPAPRTPEPQPAPTIDLASARAVLAQRRATHLARLLAYADAGVFPANRVQPGALNVFIDEDGHVCAAANLMMHDGLGDLVRATAATDNFVVLGDLRGGPLVDWMLASGLTREEIALIQEPYLFQGEPLGERDRLQGVLRGVHAVLTANTDKSLDIALGRLTARPALLAGMVKSTAAG